MQRRKFITLLGSAALAWPLAARAQQPERVRRIGVLQYINESDPELQRRIAVFVQGLQTLGWREGRQPCDRLSLWSARIPNGCGLTQPNSWV